MEQKYVIPAMFKEVYDKIEKGSHSWANLVAPNGKLYPWDASSTYIKNPPYFDELQKVIQSFKLYHSPVCCHVDEELSSHFLCTFIAEATFDKTNHESASTRKSWRFRYDRSHQPRG